MYLNDWSNFNDMIGDFGLKPEDERVQGIEVLLASYGTENYTGDAFVLFRKDGKLFEVNGSHCSCFGLSELDYSGTAETQWKPEETSVEALRVRLKSDSFGGEDGYGSGNRFRDELATVLDNLK